MKKIIALIILLMNIGSLFAESIDRETAKTVATNFMYNKLPEKGNTIKSIYNEEYNGELVYYVINFTEGGWVLVSADNNTYPILGYSLDGHIDNSMTEPTQFTSWMNNYKEQIIKSKSLKSRAKSVKNSWDELLISQNLKSLQFSYTPGTRLLNTSNRGEVLWGQDKNNDGSCTPSYNQFCPDKNCDDGCDNKASAGCGAVAMAQIMWYWRWPSKSSYRAYDWDLMPNKLNSGMTNEGKEIAHLLRDIGKDDAANMTYWCIGTWTTVNRLVDAFKNKFKYKTVEKKVRNNWLYGDTWCELLRAEIDAGRPVLYRGDKSDLSGSKHIFVVDGYDETNPEQFHINWGWTGSYNGFFNFNDLTPGEYEYNENQMAIIGISPTCSQAPENITDVPYSIVSGFNHEQAQNNISLPDDNESLTVTSGGKLIHTAGNSINLNPGFSAETGSVVKAEINTISFSQQGIDVTAWTNYFPTPENDQLSFTVHNANTWEFQAFTLNGSLVYQSAGTIQGNEVNVWDGAGVASGFYDCIIKFRNSCGELLTNSYLVYCGVTESNKITAQKLSGNKKENVSLKPDIHIFPNPNNALFTLSVSNYTLPFNVRCFNSLGEVVYEKHNILTGSHRIDLGSAPAGIYMLKVIFNNREFFKKFVIK